MNVIKLVRLQQMIKKRNGPFLSWIAHSHTGKFTDRIGFRLFGKSIGPCLLGTFPVVLASELWHPYCCHLLAAPKKYSPREGEKRVFLGGSNKGNGFPVKGVEPLFHLTERRFIEFICHFTHQDCLMNFFWQTILLRKTLLWDQRKWTGKLFASAQRELRKKTDHKENLNLSVEEFTQLCCLRCLPKIHFSTQRFKLSQTVQTRKQKGVYDIPVKPPRCWSVKQTVHITAVPLVLQACKTPLHPNNNAIIFVPKRTCIYVYMSWYVCT